MLKYIAVLLLLELIVCLIPFVPVQAAGAITLSPASGTVGSSVTISGAGYNAAGETINVTFDTTPVVTGYSATAATWSAYFIVPASTSGSHTITARGSVSGPATSAFNVTPKITVSQAGTTIYVNGTGFANSENITVTVDGNPVTYTTASSIGSWSVSIPFVAAGSHAFAASGSQGNSASTIFNVISYSTIALSRTRGSVGISITINGNGFAINETGITVTFDGNQVGASTTASSTGAWTLTFTIPSASAGPHTIGAYGSTTTASSVPTQTFTITPGLTLNKSSAPPGATVTASGSGFVANETGINVTYDGNPIGTPTTASATGTWTTTFVVPQGSAGTHSVGAYGANTAAGSVPVFTFTVGAGISISKTSGGAGTSVTVNGAGFGSGETGITVTYDGNPVGSPVTAGATGSWSSTFTIPPSPAGAHTIGASGSVTAAASVPIVTFTSTSSVTINTSSGTVGSSVILTGAGFGANEPNITLTYDSIPLGSPVSADATGGWTSTIIIPPSAAGLHTIAVKGPITTTTGTGNLSYKVMPFISTDYSSGYVGASINVSGSGFAANSALQFTYDNGPISNIGTVTTDASGSFTQTITIPVSNAGPHTIRVLDAQNNASSVSFTVNSVTLSVPNPLSPADGSKVGLTGNITPDFSWSPVTDPNGGITYSLQIDTDPNFPHPLLDITGLTVPHYTLNKAESLPHGIYYWRVMATDAASNQSVWSKPVTLQSGILSATMLVAFVIIFVAAVIVALYLLIIRPMQRRRKAQEAARAPAQAPEIVIPEVVNAEYRNIEPEGSGKKQRALPWRLALPQAPQPAKGTARALPPGDQARLKIIIDFAKSLPLIEPGNNTDWLIELAESGSGEAASPALYARLVKGELQVRYEPAWMRHPTFMDLQTLLEGQPILQDLNSFVDSVNHSASEALLLLQDIYRDTTAEVTRDVLANNGWGFISGVYTDALSWFLGKYLREPSDRDYSIKPDGKSSEGTDLTSLYGEQTTPFAGLLINAPDEKEALRLRTLHLKLRRTYRNNDKAREVVDTIARLDVQRGRLLNAFSQFNRLNPTAYTVNLTER